MGSIACASVCVCVARVVDAVGVCSMHFRVSCYSERKRRLFKLSEMLMTSYTVAVQENLLSKQSLVSIGEMYVYMCQCMYNVFSANALETNVYLIGVDVYCIAEVLILIYGLGLQNVKSCVRCLRCLGIL